MNNDDLRVCISIWMCESNAWQWCNCWRAYFILERSNTRFLSDSRICASLVRWHCRMRSGSSWQWGIFYSFFNRFQICVRVSPPNLFIVTNFCARVTLNKIISGQSSRETATSHNEVKLQFFFFAFLLCAVFVAIRLQHRKRTFMRSFTRFYGSRNCFSDFNSVAQRRTCLVCSVFAWIALVCCCCCFFFFLFLDFFFFFWAI